MTRIYSEHRAFMFGVAYGKLRNRADADDAVQNAAITLMGQRNRPQDERGMAYTMVDYAARDMLRRRAAEQARLCHDLLLAEEQHPTAPSAEREAMARLDLQRVAAEAPPSVLALAAGYTMVEIAERTGEPYQTEYSRVMKWRRENR